jgi:flagellar biosynthesis protein FlhG
MLWGDKTVIAVGGGKGGVGKSSFAANAGVVLAQNGHKVVLVDADLGAANLHTIIGVTYPERTLDDFVHGRSTNLEDTLLETPFPNLRLLSSASDVLSIAAPNYSQRQKLLRAIKKLDADTIIFDIAAGTNSRAIDFFSLAPYGIILVEPTPTSLENAYSFLKNLMMRHLLRVFYSDKQMKDFIVDVSDVREQSRQLQFNELIDRLAVMAPEKTAAYRKQLSESTSRVFLVVNALRDPGQFNMADRFVRIIKRYLTLDMKVLGALPYETNMDVAITARMPFSVKYPDSGYARGLKHIVENLMGTSKYSVL